MSGLSTADYQQDLQSSVITFSGGQIDNQKINMASPSQNSPMGSASSSIGGNASATTTATSTQNKSTTNNPISESTQQVVFSKKMYFS